MAAKTPVSLTLYDRDDEPVKELKRSTIPWGILKKSVRLSENIDMDALTEDDIDNIAGLVIEIFGEDRVTVAELDDYADVGDMMSVVMSIINRATGLLPNSKAPQT